MTPQHRGLRKPAQGHTTSKWQSSCSSLGLGSYPFGPLHLINACGIRNFSQHPGTTSPPTSSSRSDCGPLAGKGERGGPQRVSPHTSLEAPYLSQATGQGDSRQQVQAFSSQLLAAILDSMRKQEMRMGGEAGQGHGAGSPAEQVKALMDLLAGKGCQGSQAPPTPDRTPDSPRGPHGNGRQMEGCPQAFSPPLLSSPPILPPAPAFHLPPRFPSLYLPSPTLPSELHPQTRGYRDTKRPF